MELQKGFLLGMKKHDSWIVMTQDDRLKAFSLQSKHLSSFPESLMLWKKRRKLDADTRF
jgi:hypothetical protein